MTKEMTIKIIIISSLLALVFGFMARWLSNDTAIISGLCIIIAILLSKK